MPSPASLLFGRSQAASSNRKRWFAHCWRSPSAMRSARVLRGSRPSTKCSQVPSRSAALTSSWTSSSGSGSSRKSWRFVRCFGMAAKIASCCCGGGSSSPGSRARADRGHPAWQHVRAVEIAEVPDDRAQVEERTVATDEELAVLRVGDVQRTRAVRIELHRVPAHLEPTAGCCGSRARARRSGA